MDGPAPIVDLGLASCDFQLIDIGAAPASKGVTVQLPWVGGRTQKTYELWFVREGVGKLRENGNQWQSLKPGMLVWLKLGNFYESQQDPDDPMGITHMQFRAHSSSTMIDLESQLGKLPLHVDAFNTAYCASCIRRIIELYWEDYIQALRAPGRYDDEEIPIVRFWSEPMTTRTSFFAPTYTKLMAPKVTSQRISMLLAHGLFKTLILEYLHLSQQDDSPELSGVSRRHQQVINDLIFDIQADLRQKPSVQEMAVTCGYSMDHFCRVFRKVSGTGPQEYFLNMRIYRARELLTASELSVKEIASSLGYASAAFFSRQFKTKTSMSPKQFRETFARIGD